MARIDSSKSDVAVYAPSDPNSSDYHKRNYRIVWREPDGRRRSTYQPTKAKAEAERRAICNELADFTEQRRGRSEHRTVDELIERWLDPTVNDGWDVDYREDRRQVASAWLSPHLGALLCSEWDVQHTEALMGACSHRAPGTRKNILVGAQSLADTGRRLGWIERAHDPCAFVKVRAKDVRTSGEHPKWVRPELVPAASDVWAMAAELPSRASRKHPMPQLVNAVLLGAYCGLRLGECLGLRRRRLTLVGPEPSIHVREQRTSRGTVKPPKHKTLRDVPLPSWLIEHLWLPDGPDDLMVPSAWGKPLGYPTFYTQYWTPARVELMWPTEPCRTPDQHRHERCWVWGHHSLRHFYATWGMEDRRGPATGEHVPDGIPDGGGLGLKAISQFLGHKSVKVTADRYVSASRDAMENAHKALNGG